jgi:hypothetical protein
VRRGIRPVERRGPSRPTRSSRRRVKKVKNKTKEKNVRDTGMNGASAPVKTIWSSRNRCYKRKEKKNAFFIFFFFLAPRRSGEKKRNGAIDANQSGTTHTRDTHTRTLMLADPFIIPQSLIIWFMIVHTHIYTHTHGIRGIEPVFFSIVKL